MQDPSIKQNQLKEAMQSIELDKYYDVLVENEVTDLKTASDLTADDLKEMGFSIGAKTKMLRKMQDLKDA